MVSKSRWTAPGTSTAAGSSSSPAANPVGHDAHGHHAGPGGGAARWAFEVGRFFEGVDAESRDEDLSRIAPGFPVFRVEA